MINRLGSMSLYNGRRQKEKQADRAKGSLAGKWAGKEKQAGRGNFVCGAGNLRQAATGGV